MIVCANRCQGRACLRARCDRCVHDFAMLFGNVIIGVDCPPGR